MPSGRTHDRITLWSLPFVAGLTFGLTQSGNLTLFVSGGFLFSGLMFGPDLDIHSRQFIRWGWLRWIWIPYQKSLRHRSIFSHGLIIGTILRVLYLAGWLGIVSIFGLEIARQLWSLAWSWQEFTQVAMRSLTQHYPEWLALLLGLELGAMSHSFSDWGGSAYKRFKTHGISGLISAPKKKKRSRQFTSKRKTSRRPRIKPKA